MNTAFYTLGWRSLWRDLRAGELRLLIVAVSLAVAALTAVGFFADRLNGGLQRDARQLLGGDAVISSDNPTPPVFIAKAKELGLQTAQTLGFPTMARSQSVGSTDPMTKLVALKAVSEAYPLRGNLQIAAKQGAAPAKTRAVPAVGEAWVDAALLDGLGLQVGDKLLLGDAELRIGQIITTEPDRGAGFANFAPRVMVNMAGMAATGLIQPASRVTYRLAVAGTSAGGPAADEAVKAFAEFAKGQINAGMAGAAMPGVRLESFEGGRPEMKQTLERAEKFLSLIALLAALLSAVAVALAARSFASKHLDNCAMLRVLGQSQRNIGLSYTFEFALVGLFASGLGSVNIAQLNLGENQWLSTLVIYFLRGGLFGLASHVLMSAVVGAGIGYLMAGRAPAGPDGETVKLRRPLLGIGLIALGYVLHFTWNSPIDIGPRFLYQAIVPFVVWWVLWGVRRAEARWFRATLAAPGALADLPPAWIDAVKHSWFARQRFRASIVRAYGPAAGTLQRRLEARLSDLADAVASGDKVDAERLVAELREQAGLDAGLTPDTMAK